MIIEDTVTKLRLGIDAKWYFQGPPSGKMVVKNLVNEIIINNDNRFSVYLIFANRDKLKAKQHFFNKAGLIFLPDVPNLLANVFFSPLAIIKHKLDVVLYQNFCGLWPRRLTRIAYIHDMLFLDYPMYFSGGELFYFNCMKYLAAKAGKIITISISEKKRLVDKQVKDEDNIAVVYHGINSNFKPLSFYSQAAVTAINLKYKLPARYILFVGRINPRKNLTALLNAIDFLDDENIGLVITGDGRSAPWQLGLNYKTGSVNQRVTFTGHVDEEDLYLIYARAAVFCYPSYAEGFGLPPLEAMQCGVPVVVSNRTAMPEICGQAAIYIDPGSSKDIALKINALLNNSELYNQQVQLGFARSAKFKWGNAAVQLLNIISETYASRNNTK